MDGVASCAAAMQMDQQKLEVAANNLANAETDGFHRHVLNAAGDGALHETVAGGHQELRPTGRPLDLAVAGNGLLHVAPLDGSGYDAARAMNVRSASFRHTAGGLLVDDHGRALLGEHGPLRIPTDLGNGELTIRADGTFASGGKLLGRVPLARNSELRSGFLEGSSVNPIGEMLEILDAQRSFESAQKSLVAIDQTRDKSVNDVGQIR